MENADENLAGGGKTERGNPNNDPNPPPSEVAGPPPAPSSRTPFTSLSQVDADLALARALQDQERAYMMLTMNGNGRYHDGSEFGSEEGEDDDEVDGDEHDRLIHDDDEEDDEMGSEEVGSDYEEDAFDANAEGVDSAAFDGDEAYARALQEAEEREVAIRLMAMAGLGDCEQWAAEHHGEIANASQDAWQEVDPDELSYEELVALGEVVGTESRGLSADSIASLPSVNYKAKNGHNGDTDQCVICRLDYEDGEPIVLLACKHMYHPECINRWLQINKVCPVCSAEVSTSADRHD